MAGTTKAFNYERAKAQIGWVVSVPRGLVTFIGMAELLGALGLVLPAATGILTWLTPLAAMGLMTVMLMASGFHATRGEYSQIVANVVLLALAAFIAHGRFLIVPLS